MKYSDRLDFQVTSGLTGHYVYRGNSLFDPDYSSGGHQPSGYNFWKQAYDRYRVFASRIKIHLISTTTASGASAFNSTNVEFGLIPTLDAVQFTAQDYMAKPYCKWKVNSTLNNAGSNSSKLSHYMMTDKILGQHKGYAKVSDHVAGTAGGNPALMWYWHVFVQACDLTTTQAVTAFVEIDYYCELYARIAGVTAPDTAFEGPTGATGTFTTSFDVIAGSTGTEFTDINVTT